MAAAAGWWNTRCIVELYHDDFLELSVRTVAEERSSCFALLGSSREGSSHRAAGRCLIGFACLSSIIGATVRRVQCKYYYYYYYSISFQSQPVAQLGAQASGSALHRCFESTKPHGQGRVPLRIAANSRPTQRIRKTQRSRSY